jgi:hypothetical protein
MLNIISKSQRRAQEFNFPTQAKLGELLPFGKAILHQGPELREEACSIETRQNHNELACWSIGHINEAMPCASRYGDQISNICVEGHAIHLV